MRNCSPLQSLGANNGNRTHLYTLGRYHSTDELYSHRGEEALLKSFDFKWFTNHNCLIHQKFTRKFNNGLKINLKLKGEDLMINVENTRIELEHLYIKSYMLCVRWLTKLLQISLCFRT